MKKKKKTAKQLEEKWDECNVINLGVLCLAPWKSKEFEERAIQEQFWTISIESRAFYNFFSWKSAFFDQTIYEIFSQSREKPSKFRQVALFDPIHISKTRHSLIENCISNGKRENFIFVEQIWWHLDAMTFYQFLASMAT